MSFLLTSLREFLKHLNYIRDKDLGFRKDNLLVIRQTQSLGLSFEAFKIEIRNITGVTDVGSAFGVPGEFLGSNIFTPDDPETPQLRANTLTIDKNYLRTMEMKIVEGRAFSREFNDSLSIITNETAAKTLGFKDPLVHSLSATDGRPDFEDPQYSIIGIVGDFNFNSLHS